MTDKQKLEYLVIKIQEVVPYIIGTLPAPTDYNGDEWLKVHAGRARSSEHQLKQLLEIVEQYKK